MNTIERLRNHPSAFVRNYLGGFSGILRWPQLEQLWQWLGEQTQTKWYLYRTDAEPPQGPIAMTDLKRALVEIDDYLHQTHNADYCGVVYVDQMEDPTYIKVYNPKGMGSSCSMSEIPPLPKWIISREPPEDLRPLLQEPEAEAAWWKIWK